VGAGGQIRPGRDEDVLVARQAPQSGLWLSRGDNTLAMVLPEKPTPKQSEPFLATMFVETVKDKHHRT
jgi:hypothetical protein